MTGFSEGDSVGFSAFSSCIFFDQTNKVIKFKRFAHVVVGAAQPGLFSDIAVTGHDDEGNRSCLLVRLQRTAKCVAAHSLQFQIGENDRWPGLPRPSQGFLSFGHDLTRLAVTLQYEPDETGNL